MRGRSLAAAMAASVVLGWPAAAPAAQSIDGITAAADTFDARAKTVAAPTAAQRDAAAALVAHAGAGARVRWDRRFGTPRSIFTAKGYLTGPAAGAPAEVARAWLSDNRAAFGLSAADVAALAVARDHALPGTGTHVVDFQQVVGDVQTTAGGRLIVTVTSTGRVLSYAGNPAPSPGGLAGPYVLGAGQALAKVAGGGFTPNQTGTEAGWDVFARGSLATVQRVRKTAFLTAGGARPAYRVLFTPTLDDAADVVVDAGTGAVLYRQSLVAHDAEGSVYENFPGAPQGGTQVTRSFGPTPESPGGYTDPTGLTGIGGPTTFGNNANTYANYSNFLVPADQGPRPVSPTGQFDYPYEMNWQKTSGATVPPSYVLDLTPAATNLFWQHNRIHDEYYDYGFTETAGNFQMNNFEKGGSGEDAVLGLVHAGAATGGAPTYTGRDNAYFLEQPDGVPSWSGMFLWEPINDAFEGPFSDGNFDASVVQHEYTHGLSTRYVGGGEALNAQQAGAMGEGWGDWYALNHLYKAGLQSKAVIGEYVTGNPTRGIRNWNYDQNPLGFGDIGYDLTGPEVHADGEIWTATLWDLRKALVAKFGAAAGADRAEHLVTDAMPLTAPDPSFLDARDGILAADLDRYHGDDFDLIWTVFAPRPRRHPRRRRRPLPRRRLRPDLDGLRPPRRGRLGDERDRRRHRSAAGVRQPRRGTQRHARRHGRRRGQRRGGRQRARDRGRLRGPRHAARAQLVDGRLRGEARRRHLRHHDPGARLRRADVQGHHGRRGRDEAPDAEGRAEPRLEEQRRDDRLDLERGRRTAGAVPHRRHRGERLGDAERRDALQRRPRPAGHDQARQAGPDHRRPGERVQEHDVLALQRDAGLHAADVDRRRDVDDRPDRHVHVGQAATGRAGPPLQALHARAAGAGELRALLHRLGAGRDADAGPGGGAAGVRDERDDRDAGAAGPRAAVHRLGHDRLRQPGRRRSDGAAERVRRHRDGVQHDVHRAAGVAGRGRGGLRAAEGLRRRDAHDQGHRVGSDGRRRVRPGPKFPRQQGPADRRGGD